MKLIEKRTRNTATPNEKLSILATLIRKNCINYKSLLHHLVEIIHYDESLLADTVLILTDKTKINSSSVSELEIQNAIVDVRFSTLRTKSVLVATLSEAMQENW